MKYLGIIVVLVVILAGAYFMINGRGDDASTLEKGVDAIDKAQELKNQIEGSVAVVEDGTYALDTKTSNVTWTGRKSILESEHTGTFSFSEGMVTVDGGIIVEGSFDIDMESIAGDASGVIDHLRSDDWFDVSAFPSGAFSITSVSGAQMTGDLTLKDVTSTVSFPFTLEDQDGELVATAHFQIDRTQWGITFGSGSFFSDIGDNVIDDTVSISLNLRAIPEIE